MDNNNNKFNKKPQEKKIRTNWDIHSRNIRLVDEGRIVTNEVAQRLAQSRGLDLVEISFTRMSDGSPLSICKICEYGKYVYELKQKEKTAKKLARENAVDTKTIQFHLTSDVGDIERKCKQIRGFIAEGNKCRVEIFLRGREEKLRDMIVDKMNDILSHFTDIAVTDYPPKKDGRNFATVLRPISRKDRQNNNTNKSAVSIGVN